jgi:hypothetical protein
MNAHFTGFFVIGQELTSSITSPEAVIFEGFWCLMLVKSGNGLTKKILKKGNF